MRTDYLGLEAFVAISELGSFNRAAAYLNLSRTALSHRITKLESDLGVQLLLRSSRDVSLTKEAQALLPEIRRDLTRLSEAYAALSNRGRDKQERLRFACVPTFAYSYLPAILHAFSAERPDIVVQLQDQPVARIYDLVREGDVEFGISIVGARHSDLDIREIYTEPYVLLVRRDHPLAARESVTRADLAGQPFVRIRTQSSNRQLVDDALGDYRDQIIWRYEVPGSGDEPGRRRCRFDGAAGADGKPRLAGPRRPALQRRRHEADTGRHHPTRRGIVGAGRAVVGNDYRPTVAELTLRRLCRPTNQTVIQFGSRISPDPRLAADGPCFHILCPHGHCLRAEAERGAGGGRLRDLGRLGRHRALSQLDGKDRRSDRRRQGGRLRDQSGIVRLDGLRAGARSRNPTQQAADPGPVPNAVRRYPAGDRRDQLDPRARHGPV